LALKFGSIWPVEATIEARPTWVAPPAVVNLPPRNTREWLDEKLIA
jgi:hypothetical protein